MPRIPAVDWLVFLSWFLQNSRSNENTSELVSLQGSVIQRSFVSILLTMLKKRKLIELLLHESIIRLGCCCKFSNTPLDCTEMFLPYHKVLLSYTSLKLQYMNMINK